MSSTGQIVGGIVGGVIGFFVGGGPVGAIRGAAIGASIGGYIDPPPGPNLSGPTLDDKSFQSTAYGVSLATLHGSIATTGNIIYLENNEYKAVARKESTGGKGGGSQGSYTTTTYYATFAVALGEAMPGSRVRRIWAGGKLIYSVGIDDVSSARESLRFQESFRYYDGSQTEPDSRIESVVGVGRTPSYEGTAYIMFYDFDLTDYGNGLAGAPIKVELVEDPVVEPLPLIISEYDVTSRIDYLSPAAMVSGVYATILSAQHFSDPTVLQLNIDTGKTISYGASDPDDKMGSDPVVPMPGVSYRAAYWYHYRKYSGVGKYRQAARGFPSGVVDLGGGWWFVRVIEVSESVGYMIAEFSDGTYWVIDLFDTGSRLQVPDDATVSADADRVVVVSGSTSTKTVDIYNSALSLIDSFALSMPVPDSFSGHVFASDLLDDTVCIAVKRVGVAENGILTFAFIDIALQTLQYKEFDTNFAEWASVSPGSLALKLLNNGRINYAERASKDLDFSIQKMFTVFSLLDFSRIMVSPVTLSDIVSGYLQRSGISEAFFDVTALSDTVDGYRFSGPGSARGALGPLQVAYLFDLVETGYSLAAVTRGSVADEVVPWQHLDARKSGEAPTVLVKKDYETDSQLPSRYSLTYLDYNREYDTNTQYATFPSRRVNERNESLAIVMDADRAAQLTDVLGNLAWVERNTFVFTVPQLYLGWRPGDVKTIELSPGNLATLRINDITYTEDQRLEINARLAEPAVYQSGATGVPADPPSEVVPFVGPSVAVLMDIPMILDSTDIPGFVGAMYGAGSWPGGVLFRSIDNGQTYTGIQAFTGQATIGEALNVLGADDGLIIDRSSELTIQPLAGTFDAITEAQMLTGQHYCAYGVDGRWEIIRYADSVLNGDGTRTLSTFIRGYRGTEWATGLHEIGDYIVLLDDPDNAFIGSDLTQLSIERLYKPVTVGQDLESAEPFEFTYQGVNLEPLSPVLPIGEIVSDDWVIEWTPRTRYSSNYWYTGTQPQNESVMAWEVDVLDGSAVVRTLSSSTPTITYTEAQQIEDFGSAQSTIDIVIYQVSQRVGRGYPLEVTF